MRYFIFLFLLVFIVQKSEAQFKKYFDDQTLRLDYYEGEEIERIVTRSAKLLGIPIESEAIREVAHRARYTPRVANRILRRVRDFAEVKSDGKITVPLAQAALNLLEVDKLGLDRNDRRFLLALIEKFRGGPVGINSLAAATNEEEDTIEDIYEPYLMRLGLLTRTPKGRTATAQAYEHLGLKAPQEPRSNPLL